MRNIWLFSDTELQRLRTDISLIKSLLLRGDQFPSVPLTANDPQNRKTVHNGQFTTEIPSWQIRENNSGESDSLTPEETISEAAEHSA
jgi:hypothetical protein